MEKSENNQFAKCNRRTVQVSTTLNRRYTKRPEMRESTQALVRRSPQITRFGMDAQIAQPTNVLVEPVTELIDDEMDNLMFNEFDEMPSKRTQRREDIVSTIPADWMGQATPRRTETQDRSAQQAQQAVTVPSMITSSERIVTPKRLTTPQIMNPSETLSQQISERVEIHPLQVSANSAIKRRNIKVQDMDTPKVSAKELKEQAIRRAMIAASQTETEDVKNQTKSKKSRKSKKVQTVHFGFGRVMLALGCAVASVTAIVYFVNMNAPDISLRVAAMQTGMDPSYPTYIPRNYSVSGITSKDSEITIDFVNSVEGKKFSLTEEKSSWDTNALLANFVKSAYNDDYTTVKEQGLTIYISGSNAAWVNGGNVYKIEATNGTLTNKQIKSIAVSL